MIYTPENSKDKILIDERGVPLGSACEFNEETGEVTFIVLGSNRRPIVDNGEILKAKVIMKNARIVIKGSEK